MYEPMNKHLEALLTISEVLRAHNRLRGGISPEEACKRIYEAVKPLYEEDKDEGMGI